MDTHKNFRLAMLRRSAIVTFVLLLLSEFTGTAIAASSWNPTLLVNTESFQTIDEGDSTTDVEIRFGSTLNEKIYWDRTGGRFRFSDDVFVENTLSASGTLFLESGAYIDGSTLKIDANSNRVGIGTTSPDTELDVVGTISGSTARISSTIYSSGSIILESHLTGATIAGFGLPSGGCTGAFALRWNSSTKQFECAADAQGSSNFGTGNVLTIGNARYVLKQGDTMTGALNINVTGGNNNTIGFETPNTASGRIVHAQDLLRSSGSLIIENGATFESTATVFGLLSGSQLRISGGGADIQGALNASGAVRTDSGMTLNADADTNNVPLIFGSDTLNETLQWLNTADTFEFSDDLRVTGTLSASGTLFLESGAYIDGSTLKIDANSNRVGIGTVSPDTALEVIGTASGTIVHAQSELRSSGSLVIDGGSVSINALNYTFPTLNGSSGSILKNNGNGTLSWATGTSGGSGDILALEPEYNNVTYTASGAAGATGNVGTLAYSYDSTNRRNHYRWQTTKTANQAYWVATRVRIPNNFASWDSAAPIQFNYRSSGSYLEVKMSDTAGTAIPLTGASNLRNANWTTANITGPQSTGTYTKGGFINVFVKLVGSGTTLTTDEFADAGTLQFNWETTNP